MILVAAVVLAFVLLTSLRGIASFYTDYLWFDSLDQGGVFRGILGAKVVLAIIFIALFFVLAWVNLLIADRTAPPYRLSGPEDELLERYHDLVSERSGWVRTIVAGLLAIIAGSGVSAEWNSWLLFTNGGDFGVTDEQFHQDIGFYVFKLPFLSFVVDWLFASLLIILILVTVAHYLNGGIRVQPPAPRVSAQVKAHLSVLLAALALIKAADYWLQRFELTVSSRGVVDGATYTDVKAQLPALNLLVLISLAAAVLFVANIFRRGWTLPVLAVGLWVFVAVVVGGIYPQFVQRVQVKPNESAKERPYIERNIDATRDALGLREVRTERFTPSTEASDVSLAGAGPTIRNIRLWDPAARLSGQTFEQLQRIRNFYAIDDIDVDRYVINGELTQVNVGARTINPETVPGDSWESDHLAYTHGYGVVMAPSNASQGNEPEFIIGNVPPDVAPRLVDSGITLDPDASGIYFGEDIGGYVMVGADRDEIDYSGEDDTKTTRYAGEDGVPVNSLLRRAAFSLRFGDLNPLISDFMTDETKVVFRRDVVDRVRTLAPFLDADGDPYPVVVDGRVTWVVDLYTTTSRYPYSQEAETDQLAEDSGLRHDFNYVRNSVKAAVDAYDGSVTLYVVDDEPIVRAYAKAFPDLFTPGDEMPEGLRAHMRYPEDLFRIQTSAYGRYHLTDPDNFYTQEDAWRVAPDPGTAGADPATPVTDTAGQATGESRGARIAPYYQLLQLPNPAPEEGTAPEGTAPPAAPEPESPVEMVMMRPFVPQSEDDSSQLMTAFMAARMDGDHYGELVVYEMPRRNPPAGPNLAAATISADEAVSELENLLGDVGSEVRRGNMLLVPIDNALLYVQPFYVVDENATRQLPRLERVVVVFNDDVVIKNTLAEALTDLFGQQTSTQEQPTAPRPETGTSDNAGDITGAGDDDSPVTGTAAEQAATLLAEADTLFTEAEAELKENGDIGAYQDKVREAQGKIDEAITLLEGGGDEGDGGSGSTDTSSGTTPTTAPSG
ncbi:MAG TPA: UPF0182 family protein [Acidimicrobiales bacterium]|nr:UPF0182 family protein [Acidimicrobiales bacterium]